MNALDTCNACDLPIETPNPAGYCDACLRSVAPAIEWEERVCRFCSGSYYIGSDGSYSPCTTCSEGDPGEDVV